MPVKKKKKDKLIKGNNVTDASKEAVCELQQRFIEKFKSSEKGKVRKQRIISKLLYNQNRYVLLTYFYQSMLPISKSYVKIFQGDSPFIHEVYYQQVNLVKKFYSYFVKSIVVAKCKKGKHLLKLDLSEKNLLLKKLMLIGLKAKNLVDKLGYENGVVVEFLDCVMKAYVDCRLYLKKKLPLENDTLKAFTAIDPVMVTSPNELVLTRLLNLSSLVPNLLNVDDEKYFNKEVRAVMVDSNLPSATCMVNDKEQDVDCLKWWKLAKEHYPFLFKLVTGILSIFHGSRVESLFNVMGNIIDKKLGRINLATYSAIEDIKSELKARHLLEQNQCVKGFHRKSRLYTPINPALTRNMRNSFSLYNAKQKTGKDKLVKCRQEFNLGDPDCATNKKLKLDPTKQAEKAQNHHQQVLAEAYITKKLFVQIESPENTKNGQEEPIDLDVAEPAEPIHVDEQLIVSRK